MIEYTLLNVLVLEMKIYCGSGKLYERSKFGQYDEAKNRAPLAFTRFSTFWVLLLNFLNYFVWMRITDEGLLPKMRIWSMLLIKQQNRSTEG